MRHSANRYPIAILLALSTALLALLIPGGPIETRTFPHLDIYVLILFNLFLTLLGITSAITSYFVLKNRRWSFVASALCAISYLLVYILDLGAVFPVSLDPVPPALFAAETVGISLSIPLLILSFRSAIARRQRNRLNRRSRSPLANRDNLIAAWIAYGVIALGFLGTGIVIFATKAAIGS